MDVSSYELEPGGQELIQMVVSLTELPELMIQRELEQILEIPERDSPERDSPKRDSPKRDSEDVTLEQLREAMLAYLELVDQEVTAGLAASSERYLKSSDKQPQ